MAATPVPALPPPLGLNGYGSLSGPTNGHQATEALYTNGIHPFQGFMFVYKTFKKVCFKLVIVNQRKKYIVQVINTTTK